MAKRLLPSLPDIKKLIGANYDRFVGLITGNPVDGQPAVIKSYTTTERDALVTADLPTPYLVYNSTTKLYNYWDGTAWQVIGKKLFSVYRALLTQTGTAAPTAKVLQNELSAAIVWARSGAGTYTGTLNGAFTADNTVLIVGGQMTALRRATLVWTSANVVTLTTNVLANNAGTLEATATDAIITDLAVEILVYP